MSNKSIKIIAAISISIFILGLYLVGTATSRANDAKDEQGRIKYPNIKMRDSIASDNKSVGYLVTNAGLIGVAISGIAFIVQQKKDR